MHHVYAVPSKPEEGSTFGTVVTSGWLLATFWVLGIEQGPLEEQPVLLTVEPFFQSLYFHLKYVCIYIGAGSWEQRQ